MDIRDGDYVKVTYKGEVTGICDDDKSFLVDGNHCFDYDNVEVKLISRRHVSFEPGTRVVNKISGNTYTVGKDGYYSHQHHNWQPMDSQEVKSTFTTKSYEAQ